MTVSVPSEPANYCHLLRAHAMDGVRRPLVVFTPKWMLRDKAGGQPAGRLHRRPVPPVIDDPRFRETDARDQVRKVLLCCGKLYWEMAAAIEKRGLTDVALVRLEQLYPVPDRRLAAVLDRYPNAEDMRWVQEEPGNQGAWPFLGLVLPEKLPRLVGMKRVTRRGHGRARRRVVQGARGRAAGADRRGALDDDEV